MLCERPVVPLPLVRVDCAKCLPAMPKEPAGESGGGAVQCKMGMLVRPCAEAGAGSILGRSCEGRTQFAKMGQGFGAKDLRAVVCLRQNLET